MCNHVKFKTSENDRKFLKSVRIAPFGCCMCEGKSKVRKELPSPKLRVEEPSHDDNEAEA